MDEQKKPEGRTSMQDAPPMQVPTKCNWNGPSEFTPPQYTQREQVTYLFIMILASIGLFSVLLGALNFIIHLADYLWLSK
jgi:hypothetical protein